MESWERRLEARRGAMQSENIRTRIFPQIGSMGSDARMRAWERALAWNARRSAELREFVSGTRRQGSDECQRAPRDAIPRESKG